MVKKFSERIGAINPVQTIQTEGMSDALRNSLWNFLHSQFESRWDYWIPLAKFIAQYFRKVPIDELPFRDYECRKWIKAYFYDLEWYEVYDLIEFLVINNQHLPGAAQRDRKQLEEKYNAIFALELSGFRFIAGIIAPISIPAETQEVTGALELSNRSGMQGAHAHIQTALKLLGRKPTPDYRNSIKESISAVESIAKQISGSDAQGLSGALAALEARVQLHGALKQGFLRLYGFTSDADGIRHAILEEPNVGFDEAKYMLVSCSAFVNYLISKAGSSGLLDARK